MNQNMFRSTEKARPRSAGSVESSLSPHKAPGRLTACRGVAALLASYFNTQSDPFKVRHGGHVCKTAGRWVALAKQLAFNEVR